MQRIHAEWAALPNMSEMKETGGKRVGEHLPVDLLSVRDSLFPTSGCDHLTNPHSLRLFQWRQMATSPASEDNIRSV